MQLKDYYRSRAPDLPDLPDTPSLEDLRSLIELVHHACQCGAYDEADSIRWEYISQKDEFYITSKLGAWETDLEVTREFFPEADTSQEPQVSRSWNKAWILSEVGLCLSYIGRGDEARNSISEPYEFVSIPKTGLLPVGVTKICRIYIR
jgi:hypothetical protein